LRTILSEFDYNSEQLEQINILAKKSGLCLDTVKILYGRGVDTLDKIRHFLNPSKQYFISPYEMSGMKEAVELIKRARDEDWSVVVYGDYDADGVCASTIMRRALIEFGITPAVYIPERKNGYGLNNAAIDEIFDDVCPQLFITVDCGISCAEEVNYILENGAEVIVTDHHELPEVLPDCICINPKIADNYIYDNLCGAGVAFKVACALLGEKAYQYLDFATIATIADSVPLTGENRDIVAEGLKMINKSPRKCYSSFLGKSSDPVNAQTVAFAIAPKINAAGRMGDANAAAELFASTDDNEIFDLASKLTSYNQERQVYCDELYNSAKQKLQEKGAYGRVIMLWDESWNTGFVGIVAARLAEEFSRPTILFVKNGDMLKGSARSVEGVNIFEALKACSNCISEFGGHAQAAGVNIELDNFDALETALNDYLHKNYSATSFKASYSLSGELTTLSEKFVKELEMLEPYGVGNKRPLFKLEVGKCSAKPVKPLSPHLSVTTNCLDMMYFSGSKFEPIITSNAPKVLIFEYNVSTFRGKEYIKGFIRDVIYNKNAGKFVLNDIKINNISVSAMTDVDCKIKPISQKDCQQEIDKRQEYGTIFIANEYSTLAKYNIPNDLDINLFTLSEKNLSSVILLSPKSDADLSGFERVVYLDKPLGIKIPTLAGKEVAVCDDIIMSESFESLSVQREKLLGIFKILGANCYNLEGSTAEEVAVKNPIGENQCEVLFAIKVFEELGLLTFESGRLEIKHGIKTQLSNSTLYNKMSEIIEG
jgi:single-stranded-DNA-specific exonuclease